MISEGIQRFAKVYEALQKRSSLNGRENTPKFVKLSEGAQWSMKIPKFQKFM